MVEVDRQRPDVVPVGEQLELLAAVQRAGNDVRALLGEGPGDRQPDALARAGDDGHLVGQMQVHDVPLSAPQLLASTLEPGGPLAPHVIA